MCVTFFYRLTRHLSAGFRSVAQLVIREKTPIECSGLVCCLTASGSYRLMVKKLAIAGWLVILTGITSIRFRRIQSEITLYGLRVSFDPSVLSREFYTTMEKHYGRPISADTQQRGKVIQSLIKYVNIFIYSA